VADEDDDLDKGFGWRKRTLRPARFCLSLCQPTSDGSGAGSSGCENPPSLYRFSVFGSSIASESGGGGGGEGVDGRFCKTFFLHILRIPMKSPQIAGME